MQAPGGQPVFVMSKCMMILLNLSCVNAFVQTLRQNDSQVVKRRYRISRLQRWVVYFLWDRMDFYSVSIASIGCGGCD